MENIQNDNLLRLFSSSFGLYRQQLAVLFDLRHYEVTRMLNGITELPSNVMRASVEALLSLENSGSKELLMDTHREAHRLMSEEYLAKMQRKLDRARRLLVAREEMMKRQAEFYAADVQFMSTILYLEQLKEALPEAISSQLAYAKRKHLLRTKSIRIKRYFQLMQQKHYLEAEIKALEELLQFYPDNLYSLEQ